MESLSPSTINVRLSAVRKMVGEARRAGMIGLEEAASLTDIPNISQKGTRLGNWLTREQAKELLAVPDRYMAAFFTSETSEPTGLATVFLAIETVGSHWALQLV